MNALFARASLKRSPRTRTRKPSISESAYPPSHSSPTATCDRGRPLPLHIIPELSELDFQFDSEPTPKPDQHYEPSLRLTLSAFPFSIDDALHMLNDEPRSPALSASSSTEDSNLSEELPTTPGASDDEDFFNLRFPSPRLRPHHIEIRPLCITKSRSIVCTDDEDLADTVDNDPKSHDAVVESPMANETKEEDEDEHDFYARQFQDFISLCSASHQVSVMPARPESVILSLEDAPKLPVEQPKLRGRSRFSKALPRLPFPMPPSSTLPAVPRLPYPAPIESRRMKYDIPPMPAYPPPPPPVGCRPPPRMSVPSDVGGLDFFEEEALSLEKQVWFDDDEGSICSPPSSTFVHNSMLPLSPALPETPVHETYLPRTSTDSDAPRSSLDSHLSCHSSFSSDCTPISPFSFPPTPNEESHQLRSRWSSSTLNSINVEPPRTITILSPLLNAFSSKPRRSRPAPLTFSPPALNHARAHSIMPLTRMVFPATPSPPSTPSRRVRRQKSRSSTSSLVSSECESCESGINPSGLRRKPIPVEMFLRV